MTRDKPETLEVCPKCKGAGYTGNNMVGFFDCDCQHPHPPSDNALVERDYTIAALRTPAIGSEAQCFYDCSAEALLGPVDADGEGVALADELEQRIQQQSDEGYEWFVAVRCSELPIILTALRGRPPKTEAVGEGA